MRGSKFNSASNEPGRSAMAVMDAVEAANRPCHDRYVRYSHEMSEDTAEASARTLIRVVPLIYGVLLGGILDNMLIGVSMGSALAVALDMKMGRNSFFLPVLGPVLRPLCPLMDGIAHTMVQAFRAAGQRLPAILADLHCGLRRR